MQMMTRFLAGAGTAALLALSTATPAQAQYYERYDRYDRGGIDLGDIAAGVAIIGGAALAISALTDNDRGDYRNGRYRHGAYGYGHERAAVNACASVAQRYGRLERITDVDRRSNGTLRVRGRILVRDYNYNRWGRSLDWDRDSFTCHVAGNRVYDFRV